MKLLGLFYEDERGNGLAEYILIIPLVAITAIATVGTKVNTVIASIDGKILSIQR